MTAQLLLSSTDDSSTKGFREAPTNWLQYHFFTGSTPRVYVTLFTSIFVFVLKSCYALYINTGCGVSEKVILESEASLSIAGVCLNTVCKSVCYKRNYVHSDRERAAGGAPSALLESEVRISMSC